MSFAGPWPISQLKNNIFLPETSQMHKSFAFAQFANHSNVFVISIITTVYGGARLGKTNSIIDARALEGKIKPANLSSEAK